MQNCNDEEKKKLEVWRINKQMVEFRDEYMDLVERLSELAKSVNFEIGNLECQKIDIDQYIIVNNKPAVTKDCVRYI